MKQTEGPKVDTWVIFVKRKKLQYLLMCELKSWSMIDYQFKSIVHHHFLVYDAS